VITALLDRFHSGDRLALARLLSLAARGESLAEIAAALGPPRNTARVVAITGAGGVGKSTLVGKLIEHIRASGLKVAVLACDPQSPLSGGALLGDRFRMPSRADDDGVFIRSLAAVSGHGAIAEHLDLMVRLLEAFGFDIVLIETVGAGQGDTAVHGLADVVVLLLQPETGDDLQWEKAGVLEVAEVVVIHKADLPGAEQAAAQVRAALSLSVAREIPVVRVSSRTGEGLDQLWQTILACPRRRQLRAATDGDALELARAALTARFARARDANDPALLRLLEQWRQGTLSAEDVGGAVLDLLQIRQSGLAHDPLAG
jgi:LAO/AO transport system ATPase